MIKIRSTTDTSVSLYDPTIPVRKSFDKKGAMAIIEKDKLIMIHFANIEELVLCLRINGAPEDYIEKRIKTYYHGD